MDNIDLEQVIYKVQVFNKSLENKDKNNKIEDKRLDFYQQKI